MYNVEVFFRSRARVGEGPVWVASDKALWWVDIRSCELHRTDEHGADAVYNVGAPVGFAVPRDAGGFIIGTTDGLCSFDPGTNALAAFGLPTLAPGVRFNDGKCDARGRLWCGTMPDDEKNPEGALYCLTPEGLSTKVTDVTISNGLGWNAGNDQMYYIDSALRRVDVFDYNINTGEIANRRPLAHAADVTYPDGMAVDAEGGLWVAHWGGFRVSRYDPITGKETDRVDTGARYTSSCCFGGEDMRTMFITTAGQKDEADDPLGGSVLAVRMPVAGMKVGAYAG